MFREKEIITALLLCSAAANIAYAAPAENQPDQYQVTKHQAEQQQAQIKAPVVQLQQAENANGTLVLPKEERSFLIKGFAIDRGDTRRFNWIKQELAPYKGQYIGAEGINLLTKMLSEKMIDRGFVTSRMTVPEQNLKSGILQFKVVPGYIEDIRQVN